jgi:hypothetical protein
MPVNLLELVKGITRQGSRKTSSEIILDRDRGLDHQHDIARDDIFSSMETGDMYHQEIVAGTPYAERDKLGFYAERGKLGFLFDPHIRLLPLHTRATGLLLGLDITVTGTRKCPGWSYWPPEMSSEGRPIDRIGRLLGTQP